MKDKKKLILVITAVVLISSILLLFNYINLREEKNSLKGKIGYVNIQQVFNRHPLKKDAEDELNKLAQDMQLELENKLEDVPKDEHQQLIKDYQKRLSKKENELVNNIVVKIEKTVQEIAQEKEMKVVVEEQDVVKGGHNITQLVIQRIENK
ncbi:MAG: OmpH family outer membrane protein [Halanaerobiales bacterium]|nr:OmpH family outer membrane protein [Halanaerobiales bacterium]